MTFPIDWLESRARSYMWDAYRIDNPRPYDLPYQRRGDRFTSFQLRAIAAELEALARDLADRLEATA